MVSDDTNGHINFDTLSASQLDTLNMHSVRCLGCAQAINATHKTAVSV